METQRLLQAQSAILAMPVKKVLPRLLKWVETKDDPVSLWVIDQTEKFRIQSLTWHSAEDFQQLGIAGFEILGTNAAPAVEELTKLLDQKDHIFTAERCLVFIGKPAESAFCHALTNSNASVRQWAVDNLADVTDDVVVYIDRIKSLLQDSSADVRDTSVDAIGFQASAPELAVPLLIDLLNTSSDQTRLHAIHCLAHLGTNALVALPILTNLVAGDGNVASAALETLTIIAPDKAWPIFTNYLVQGKSGINPALKALADIRPDEALPFILPRLQSSDLAIRREAFSILRHYPITPEIGTALQPIATDPDESLALAARGLLTDNYETNHPYALLFPNDPTYNGRRLGDWLGMRTASRTDLTPDANEAIHQMGTNAIPFLLKRLTYERPSYCFSPYEINAVATWGFIALHEKVASALPQLMALMDCTNDDIARNAMVAASGSGSNAMCFVTKGLTNRFADVRGLAINVLMEGIGREYPEQRRQASPLVLSLLNDSDDDIRRSATNYLKEIDPAIAAKAGIE